MNQDGVRRSAFELLGYPEHRVAGVRRGVPGACGGASATILAQIERDARYAPYLARQAQDVERLRRDEAVELPASARLRRHRRALARAARQAGAVRPTSLGQAARIEGMTPAALTQILLRVRQERARPA